ncbi:hypothetical protein CI238_07149 [Colletotrichum incanum]|uniref:Uncharacterized protein n=1 Tax=Colletotrichum incanum TaxID=1573173 RepID=A0A162NMK8_COLIC|nr:hypothetical protein CI238_07149 [Colletotrichum incanum]
MLAQPVPVPIVSQPNLLLPRPRLLACGTVDIVPSAWPDPFRTPVLHDPDLDSVHVRQRREFQLPAPLRRVADFLRVCLQVLLEERRKVVRVARHPIRRCPPHDLVRLHVGRSVGGQRDALLRELVCHRGEETVTVGRNLLLGKGVRLELLEHVRLLGAAVVRHVPRLFLGLDGSGLELRRSPRHPLLLSVALLALPLALCLRLVIGRRCGRRGLRDGNLLEPVGDLGGIVPYRGVLLLDICIDDRATTGQSSELLFVLLLEPPLHLSALLVDALARLLGRVLLFASDTSDEVALLLAVSRLHLVECFALHRGCCRPKLIGDSAFD